jgi:hypothetical protein
MGSVIRLMAGRDAWARSCGKVQWEGQGGWELRSGLSFTMERYNGARAEGMTGTWKDLVMRKKYRSEPAGR